MWHDDIKFFMETSNTIDAFLYIEDMGLVIFFGYDDKGHRTSYAMCLKWEEEKSHSSKSIFIFVEDFGHTSKSD